RPCGEHNGKIDEGDHEVHESKSGHSSTDEVILHNRLQRRPRLGEIITSPEARPRDNRQQQADFEEKCHVHEMANQTVTLVLELSSSARCAPGYHGMRRPRPPARAKWPGREPSRPPFRGRPPARRAADARRRKWAP